MKGGGVHYLEGRISHFLFALGVGWMVGVWSKRESRGDFSQGVRPLEAVYAVRSHMIFILGWVDGWGYGKVVVF